MNALILSQLIAAYTLTVAYDPSPSSDVVSYRIYWGTASGNYTNSAVVGNVLTASISGLKEMRRYYLAATAIDVDGTESVFSNEIQYLRPCTLQIATSQNGPSTVLTITTTAYVGLQFTIQGSSNLTSWSTVYSGTAATDNISVQFNPVAPIAFYRLKKSTTSPALRSMALTESVTEEVPELTLTPPTAWQMRRWNLRNSPKEAKGAERLMKMNRKRKALKAPLPPMPLSVVK